MKKMPTIGLGTYHEQPAPGLILTGLELGYRHIDTAQIYGNEDTVGQELRESSIPRSEVYITTKIWIDNLGEDRLIDSLRTSLDQLAVDQVDMTLIHWPSPNDAIAVSEYMEALAKAKQQGLTREIGVSNFTIRHLRQALDVVGKGEIGNQQIEIHPFLQNRKVIAFCQEHGIPVTAYRPLAYGKVMADKVLQSIAARHGANPAQVTLAWLLQQGLVVVPASKKRENMESNLQASRLTLSEDEMQLIASLERGERLAAPEFSPEWD